MAGDVDDKLMEFGGAGAGNVVVVVVCVAPVLGPFWGSCSANVRGAALRLRLVKAAIGDERSMAVLDAVAGRGITIRTLGGGGDVRAANVRRLVRALRAAGPLLRTTDAQLKKALANQGR